MKLLLLSICIFLASCSSTYYIPTNDEVSATVSFSNLSPEIPEVKITESCRVSRIDNALFEARNPTLKSKQKIKIPANKEISFEYSYFWVSGEKTEVVPPGNLFQSNVRSKKTKVTDFCKETITFVPEENKHYEVYFAKNSDKCVIKVSEAYFSRDRSKKSLVKVKKVSKPEC